MADAFFAAHEKHGDRGDLGDVVTGALGKRSAGIPKPSMARASNAVSPVSAGTASLSCPTCQRHSSLRPSATSWALSRRVWTACSRTTSSGWRRSRLRQASVGITLPTSERPRYGPPLRPCRAPRLRDPGSRTAASPSRQTLHPSSRGTSLHSSAAWALHTTTSKLPRHAGARHSRARPPSRAPHQDPLPRTRRMGRSL